MKSFRVTVSVLITLFLFILATVVSVAAIRPSHTTGIDPARIGEMRAP